MLLFLLTEEELKKRPELMESLRNNQVKSPLLNTAIQELNEIGVPPDEGGELPSQQAWERLKPIIRQVVEEMGYVGHPIPAGSENLSTHGKVLARYFEKHPIDPEWLGTPKHHYEPGPERIVWDVRKDVLTPAMIESLEDTDAARVRWTIYHHLRDKKPIPPEDLERWGVKESAIPAYRAHVARRGGVAQSSQFIVHVGKSKLRAALFSARQKNSKALEQFHQVASRYELPKGFRLSGPPEAKTLQLSTVIGNPQTLSVEESAQRIRKAFDAIRHFIEGLAQESGCAEACESQSTLRGNQTGMPQSGQ